VDHSFFSQLINPGNNFRKGFGGLFLIVSSTDLFQGIPDGFSVVTVILALGVVGTDSLFCTFVIRHFYQMYFGTLGK